jgi:outer membrane protein W
MKTTIFTATTTGIFCLSTMFTTTAFAQEQGEVIPKRKEIKAPKLEVGATIGLMRSMQERQFASPIDESYGNLRGNTTGLFARYYFGKHFAIEAGLSAGVTVYKDLYGTLDMGGEYYNGWLNTRSYSVPVQFQYHLLGSDSKIRPYFGIGGGITHRQYDYRGELKNGAGFLLQSFANDRSISTAFTQFTQGLTWQLNKKWQLNQSLNLQHELVNDRTNLDFRIGIAYKLW